MTTDKAALAAHLAIDKGLNAQQVALVVLVVVGHSWTRAYMLNWLFRVFLIDGIVIISLFQHPCLREKEMIGHWQF